MSAQITTAVPHARPKSCQQRDFVVLEDLREGRGSARVIIPLILELVKPKSIIDIGCGVGTWLSVIKEHGVEDVLGVDGDYVPPTMLEIPREQFLPFDLRKPLSLDRQFDLAISVEVAQQLAPESGETLLDSLVKLAPVVLFSASAPFQGGGPSHLNEQWPDYWVELFARRGFVAIDCVRKRIWQNDDVKWWYAQNLLVFADRDYVQHHPLLKVEWEATNTSQLSLIHPRKYLQMVVALSAATNPERMQAKKVLAALLFLIRNVVGLAVKKSVKRRKRALMTDSEGKQNTMALVQEALREAGVLATLDVAIRRGIYTAVLGYGGVINTEEFYDEELVRSPNSAREKARRFAQAFRRNPRVAADFGGKCSERREIGR